MSHVLALVSSSPRRTCSAVYSEFASAIPQDSNFQVALDVLVPVLRGDLRLPEISTSDDVYYASRCYCAYIVYKLYAPHPIALNPFQSALQAAFADDAHVVPASGSSSNLSAPGSVTWLSRSERIVNNVLGIILADRGSELDDFVPGDESERPSGALGDRSPSRSPHLGAATINGNRPSLSPARLQTSDWPTLLDQAQRRVLTLSEQRVVLNALPTAPVPGIRATISPESISSLASLNGRVATPALTRLLFDSEPDAETQPGPNFDIIIETLRSLPPTLSSFDLMGGLLRTERERTRDASPTIIRPLVLEPFISHCLQVIDSSEREEEGESADSGEERASRAVQLLSRFVLSVVKADSSSLAASAPPQSSSTSSVVPQDTNTSPTASFSEGLNIELTTFALHHSQFADANTLYRTLVLSRGPG